MGEEIMKGELLKLEKALITGTEEFHRRFFVLETNKLNYFRLLKTVTGEFTISDDAQEFLLSQIGKVALAEDSPPAEGCHDSNVEFLIEPKWKLSPLGLNLKFPGPVVHDVDKGSLADQCVGLVPGLQLMTVNGQAIHSLGTISDLSEHIVHPLLSVIPKITATPINHSPATVDMC